MKNMNVHRPARRGGRPSLDFLRGVLYNADNRAEADVSAREGKEWMEKH